MPHLTDEPAHRELRLLRDVAEGFAANRGAWPVWQYVSRRQDEAGVDGEAVLQGLPQWQYSYRSVWTGQMGAPDLETRVHLTIHGMVHCAESGVQDLVAAFLASIRIAGERLQEVAPEPGRVQSLSLDGRTLTEEANLRAGTGVSPGLLREVLRHEPLIWSGIRDVDDSFIWDLTHVRLRPFRDVADGAGYLSALAETVNVSHLGSLQEPLPSAALPQALDRLDLVWQLSFSKRLLNIPRASLPVVLSLPVSGVEEFDSRCSALADLLNCFTPECGARRQGGTFDRMKACLDTKLPAGTRRVSGAVDVLRAVTEVRNAQQHSASRAKYDSARRLLGLTGLGDDWAGTWEQLRRSVVGALDVIGDELLAHRDQSQEQGDP